MASPRPWPFDDDDRPSGSVRPLSPADLQAILAHLDDDPDQLLAGTGADRPVVAVRVRASVGRPGGSAQARWRRLRAAEWAAWARTLPWRVAASLGIAVGGGVLGRLVVPRFGLVVGALTARSTRRGGCGMDAASPPPCGRCRSRLTEPPRSWPTRRWWCRSWPSTAPRSPWGKVVMDGVPVVSARRLPSMLCALPVVLGPERVADLADRARVRLHAAA